MAPKGVKLFYNDYGVGSGGKKSDKLYALVKGMQQRGIPIDGVGLQMHIQESYTNVAGLLSNMKRLAALGLEVHITELDISLKDGSAASLAKQAKIYGDLVKACLAVPMCKNIETWGFTDASTWKGTDKHPLPFDEDYVAKPAVNAMLNAFGVRTPAPGPSPPGPSAGPSPAHKYEELTITCQNAKALSDKLPVTSVEDCEAKCNAQSECDAVDTDGTECYLKSHCEGTVGKGTGQHGYRQTDTGILTEPNSRRFFDYVFKQ
jgi:hypothetical protein